MSDLPIWAGVLIDVTVLAVWILLAIKYPWIWYDLFQRYEPFTKQLGRICAKRPWLWYGFNAIVLVFALSTALFAPWWARVLAIFFVGFFGWYMPHIAEAAIDPDNPPHLVQAFRWVNRNTVDREV